MNFSSRIIAEAWARLPEYLGQHVLISFCAILLGVAIGLPLAIVASRRAWLRGPAVGIASVVQTIPGLALLALFYPLLLALSAFTQHAFGFGFRALGFLPTLLALTLYSILPVLQNTVAALAGIDPAIKTAALGVGMTKWQSLFLVEIPLAIPVVMAGLRTAAVWVIGAATLSTPVGQTSLGNYIFTGLQTENWVFVLFGCVAAALLALVVDRLLALAESGFANHSRTKLISAAAGLLIVIGASLSPLLGSERKSIIIGTKSFEEQYILGALIGDRLEKAGYSTTRRDGLGSAVIFHALEAGDVDVYVDYTGTLWTTQMKRSDMPGREPVLDQLSAWAAKRGIVDLGSLGFENAYAFAMRRDRAQALGIKTLADLAAYAPKMKIGGDYEIFSRPEWRAVVKAYGLHFAAQRQYQANFMYSAVASGDVDVISAFSSDGRIAKYDLTLIGDPKQALPPYDAVVLISQKYAGDEKLLAALRPLIGSIDLKTMQRANLMVDRADDKRTPEQVADWLSQHLKH
ncbi:MAG TPA: glycine betaine ABC transporter substrate-binding protein [Rhizomicrobium sp.]|jgi:osmoprotectant transport system permease protein|nr:glycine betaine ABC transporter substrate-binding protein [Rhizomicrobium sp.]